MKEHDVVRLKKDLKVFLEYLDNPEVIIPKGAQGTIVHVYINFEVFEVEFPDYHNEVITVQKEDLEEIGMEVTSIEEEKTYRIVRKYKDNSHPDNNKEIATGLTLAEAKAHCQDPDTEEKGVWFDAFYEE